MGKKNVGIARINGIALQRDRDVSFRNLRKLAKKLRTWIDPEIWNSTADELVVLRQIPDKAITKIYTVGQLEQDLRSPFTKDPYKFAIFFADLSIEIRLGFWHLKRGQVQKNPR